MIKKAKKQLYKLILYPTFILLFYIISPLFLLFKLNLKFINVLFIFYLPNFIIIYFLLSRNYHRKSSVILKTQELQEEINITEDQIRKQKDLLSGLDSRILRYNSLKNLIEKINRQFELELVAESLLESIFELIGQRKGNCILYLVDIRTQRLNLYATKKEYPRLIIKAKEGDIFDYWVLRHASSLLIEDTRKDFRFDLDRTEAEYDRPMRSLISTALVSQEKLLGIVRLDSPDPFAYTQDDLRLLNTIADLGAVAIENAKLFKKTQELAIRDSLTLCFTKGYFLERLEEELKRNMRRQTHLSLLMLDIDHFKKYNDKFGHIAGDILLKKISQLIKDFVEEFKGLVCRYGGEEFCILIPNIVKSEAEELAQKLRRQIEKKKFILRQKKTSITVSIGIADYPLDASLVDELIQKSDTAMYKAKQKGRNKVCCI